VSEPLSPPPVTEAGRPELPAYVSNGLMGLRVLDIPLLPGICMVSGAAGIHPLVSVEASANPPYPLGGDLAINRVWLVMSPQQAEFVDQRLDFATGELTSRFTFAADGVLARVEVTTLCSREEPSLAIQEVSVEVDGPCELTLRAVIDGGRVHGTILRRAENLPGFNGATIDGSLCWESLGGLTQCGYAYVTQLVGDPEAKPDPKKWGKGNSIGTDYAIRARPGRRYRLRQIVSVVPSEIHHDPDKQAARLVARAAAAGFEALRGANRVEWAELWKGRILIEAGDLRWQEFADAAFFYLNSSVHRSAPASTSIFGLAQWHDYHYYHGLVMWDIETFSLPPLLLLQPSAAHALLEYRSRTADAARENAKMRGRRGLQFSWESGPLHGEESMPVPGFAAMYEDHGSPDIALAFAQLAHATGDERFLRVEAAPILYGVAEWITSRVTHVRGGYAFEDVLGIAERPRTTRNDAYTIMVAKSVLREAIACAERLGDPVGLDWRAVEAGLQVRVSEKIGAVMSHDDFQPNEQQGATPDPLAGIFPLWFPLDDEVREATLRYYLELAPGYIGSPMLSPLYGVWAAWLGDRRRSLQLFEGGYADLITGRFRQTMEHTRERYPDKPASGPFAANTGGFLSGLLYGLPGIRVGPGSPEEWPSRPVILPQGWRRIEIERAWVRGRPAHIVAEHGAERATLDMQRRRSGDYPIPAIARL
jgi:glycosyl hydrolase family 65